MDALRKQASKLREQVAKQHQAVFKQFGGLFTHDSGFADEAEVQCHEKLQLLYGSTRAAKHFQRDIVRGIERLISISSKQMEIVTKLAEACCKYGNDHQNSGFALGRASLNFGVSHNLVEKERENLLSFLADQMFEPLRAMIVGAPLEDARHLTHRYERIRQDVEAQIAEVIKRQIKANEVGASAESAARLQNAESKLSELRTTLSALGIEATAAMVSVEAQQQQITFQKLVAMVDAERAYHHNVAGILDKLHAEMVVGQQHSEPVPSQNTLVLSNYIRTAREDDSKLTQSGREDDSKLTQSGQLSANGDGITPFIAEVIHLFDAQADGGELSLSVGDYVVVRKVASNGWSEGECKGKAGWFPSAYVERREKAPASKVMEAGSLP